MERYKQNRLSITSIHSDSKKNLLLLQNVGRTLQRTHNHFKKTRLLHAFYLLALPVYTIFGAIIFQALDGAKDNILLELYDMRCKEDRSETMIKLSKKCNQTSSEKCFTEMSNFLIQVETCYRRWHEVNKTITHPMSDLTNAIIYAFSVYTTIGYGTISANSMASRMATVIYGAFGIPLFFAFIKEEGNQCRMCFVSLYNWVKQCKKRKNVTTTKFLLNVKATKKNPVLKKKAKQYNFTAESSDVIEKIKKLDDAININNLSCNQLESQNHVLTTKPNFNCLSNTDSNLNKKLLKNTSDSVLFLKTEQKSTIEQKHVFISGVIIFILYLLLVSILFSIMTEWDFFTAFYFLFNSVALIGFGDVFPSKSSIILANMFFIVMGVVLFSMCYFILQEEIRIKAFEASRKARMSISKYSQSFMLHTKNQWSRRNSLAFDRSAYSDVGENSLSNSEIYNSNNDSVFEKLRKRRQSAPVVTLDVP